MFAFFAMTASMVMTVYEYPTFATSGFNLVFFLLLGGILWFLPVALCAAEMATVDGWQEGGIFAWVGNTLGERFGFAAIFFPMVPNYSWICNNDLFYIRVVFHTYSTGMH
ncbi:hypothetical protein Q5M85_05540 [Paraclostridium bifermentans]|nr:hypothetical protein [Paraclostridium bifermentans]